MNSKLIALATALFFTTPSLGQVTIFDLIDILSDAQELTQTYNEGKFIEAAIKAIDLAIKTDPSRNTGQLLFLRDTLERLLFFRKNGQQQIDNLLAALEDLQRWDLLDYQPNTLAVFNKAVDDLIENFQKQRDDFQMYFDDWSLSKTCSKVVNFFNQVGWPDGIITEVPSTNQLGSVNPMYSNAHGENDKRGNDVQRSGGNNKGSSSMGNVDVVGKKSQNRQETQRPQRGPQNGGNLNSRKKAEYNQLNQGKNGGNGQGQNGSRQRQVNRSQSPPRHNNNNNYKENGQNIKY